MTKADFKRAIQFLETNGENKLLLIVVDKHIARKYNLRKAYLRSAMTTWPKYILLGDQKIHHQHIKIFTYERNVRPVVSEPRGRD